MLGVAPRNRRNRFTHTHAHNHIPTTKKRHILFRILSLKGDRRGGGGGHISCCVCAFNDQPKRRRHTTHTYTYTYTYRERDSQFPKKSCASPLWRKSNPPKSQIIVARTATGLTATSLWGKLNLWQFARLHTRHEVRCVILVVLLPTAQIVVCFTVHGVHLSEWT